MAAGMSASEILGVDQSVASRALISLIADLAWEQRRPGAAAAVRRTRDEAMALLPRIEMGDREAARRAMELVTASGRAAA